MLIVLLELFTWQVFLSTTINCANGIFVLGMALSGYVVRPLGTPFRLLTGIAGICLVVPGTESDPYAVALALPVLAQQCFVYRRERLLSP